LLCKDIAEVLGWSHGSVRNVHAEYIKYGDEAFNLNGKGGRYHENLSLSDEKEIIKMLEKKGKEGGILEVSKVKKAYEKKAGKEVHKSVIYRMLSRHNWRKVSPRKNHPKNKKENIDTFKKTSGVWYQMPNGQPD
jgi:transposase